eukprot:g1107.t1
MSDSDESFDLNDFDDDDENYTNDRLEGTADDNSEDAIALSQWATQQDEREADVDAKSRLESQQNTLQEKNRIHAPHLPSGWYLGISFKETDAAAAANTSSSTSSRKRKNYDTHETGREYYFQKMSTKASGKQVCLWRDNALPFGSQRGHRAGSYQHDEKRRRNHYNQRDNRKNSNKHQKGSDSNGPPPGFKEGRKDDLVSSIGNGWDLWKSSKVDNYFFFHPGTKQKYWAVKGADLGWAFDWEEKDGVQRKVYRNILDGREQFEHPNEVQDRTTGGTDGDEAEEGEIIE